MDVRFEEREKRPPPEEELCLVSRSEDETLEMELERRREKRPPPEEDLEVLWVGAFWGGGGRSWELRPRERREWCTGCCCGGGRG